MRNQNDQSRGRSNNGNPNRDEQLDRQRAMGGERDNEPDDSRSAGQDRGQGQFGSDREGQGQVGRNDINDGYGSQGELGRYGGQGFSSQRGQDGGGRKSEGNFQKLSHRGKGPKGFVRSDERLKEEVSHQLELDHDVDATEIDVRVEGGEVTLTGTVSDRMMKYRAEEIADNVSGIRSVDNQIKVVRANQPNSAQASSRTDDAKRKNPTA